MREEQYILGIHLGHDATATLINSNGKVVAAVAEERLTRVKFHTGFPYRSIEQVIQLAGISKSSVTTVASATLRLFYRAWIPIIIIFCSKIRQKPRKKICLMTLNWRTGL